MDCSKISLEFNIIEFKVILLAKILILGFNGYRDKYLLKLVRCCIDKSTISLSSINFLYHKIVACKTSPFKAGITKFRCPKYN